MALYFLNAEFNYPPELVEKVSVTISKYVEEATQDLGIASPFDVTIYPNHEWTEETERLDGDALSGGVVQIRIDLRDDSFKIENLLGTPLKGVVYHEINHIARWQGPGYGSTLLEATISEGLATVYERSIVHPYPVPHADYSNIEELLHCYRNRNKNEDECYNHRSWFFGTDLKYPKYLGYKVGTYIVDQALTLDPSLTIKEMTLMESDKILKLSKIEI